MHGRTKTLSGSILSIILLLVISTIFVVLFTYKEHKGFVDHQNEIAGHSVSGATENITLFLEGLRTSLTFFVDGNRELLGQMANNPDDSDLYAHIDKLLLSHYPDYYAFTLADSEGQILYDDFGERVGEACRIDIQEFASSQQPMDIYIHPGPGEYHIDLMLPWDFMGKRTIFFVSLKVDAIGNLLHNTQVAGHELMLVRVDRTDLIEVTASGSRADLGESPRLNELQRKRILAKKHIAGTRWMLLDIASKSLFSKYDAALFWRAGGVIAIFLFAAGIMIWRIMKEERARRIADEALKVYRDQLEKRVSERTADLTAINLKMQYEVDQRRKLSSALEQSDDLIVITDLNGITEYVNPAFEKKTGISAEKILGHKQYIVESGEHDKAYYRRMWARLHSGQVVRDIFISRGGDGNDYHEQRTITPLRDENDGITHFVATGKDITKRILAEKEIEKLAYRDVLTGLANRRLMLDRLEHAMAHAEREGKLLAVLFLDLDRFKTINDSLGHSVGDQWLKTIANRLRRCARDSDTVARLGGDEFALVIENARNVMEIANVAQRILDAISEPTIVEGHDLNSTVSIGISIFPPDDGGIDSLLKNADTAMYHKKNQGGNGFEFYVTEMGVSANRRMTMETRLRSALERDEFCLHYQPRVNLKDGRVSGVEALLRWESPELGMVTPLEFIPILEETGLIMEVGEWVLRQACNEFGALYPDLRLAVNLSSRQFAQAELAERITDVLVEAAYNPAQLDIEITESVLASDPDVAVEILQRLHKTGIHIAIDDFGTGYSSLSYIKRFPIDCLKVDRSFVQNLASDSDDVKLVTAIIALAHSLHMTVVTEGIETAEQLAVVRDLKSEEGQGYLFSRPLPLAELIIWLDSGRAFINTA